MWIQRACAYVADAHTGYTHTLTWNVCVRLRLERMMVLWLRNPLKEPRMLHHSRRGWCNGRVHHRSESENPESLRDHNVLIYLHLPFACCLLWKHDGDGWILVATVRFRDATETGLWECRWDSGGAWQRRSTLLRWASVTCREESQDVKHDIEKPCGFRALHAS